MFIWFWSLEALPGMLLYWERAQGNPSRPEREAGMGVREWCLKVLKCLCCKSWSGLRCLQSSRRKSQRKALVSGMGRARRQARQKEKRRAPKRTRGKKKVTKAKSWEKAKAKRKEKGKKSRQVEMKGALIHWQARGCLRELEFAARWRCYRSSLFAAGKGADPWATPVAMRHKERLQQEKKAEEELHGCDMIFLLLVLNFSTSHLFGKRDATVWHWSLLIAISTSTFQTQVIMQVNMNIHEHPSQIHT